MSESLPRPAGTPPALDSEAALFVDVDGTLLEIASRPELVSVPPHLPALLDGLSRGRGGALALVSGRLIADLDELFRPWRGAVAGLHGGERRRPDGTVVRRSAGAGAAALDRARPLMAAFAGHRPGVWLEDKGATLALHYRDAPERSAEVGAFAREMLRGSGGALRLIAGKMVFELQPAQFGKGGAIAAFLAEPPFCGRRPIFLGDDATDEDGFAEINRRGGISIRVGAPTASAAGYALPAVADALSWLTGAPCG